MFNENTLIDALTSLPTELTSVDVRFDPESPSAYASPSESTPSMYMLGAPYSTYFYSNDHIAFLSIDVNDVISYNFSLWKYANKFAVSIISLNDLYSDDIHSHRDTVRIGIFHSTEEEHFQEECLNGTPLSWKFETILKSTLLGLSEKYEHLHSTEFLKVNT